MDYGDMTVEQTKKAAIEVLGHLNDEEFIEVILKSIDPGSDVAEELVARLSDY